MTSKTCKVYIYSFLGGKEIIISLTDTILKSRAELSANEIENCVKLIKQSKQLLKPGMATVSDKLFHEANKPTVLLQSHHNLSNLFKALKLKRGSSFELVFKLVMFFNSLPGIIGS